ncbi:hypothetical protein JS533_001035 [Bifidobacterium amazonense]|uniref:Uncharacterized protein n=1 Tax=Bifidobacterium amazonense TaxID=2809027 RepID=A0ABS9VS22_9BIFI|nr:hypothetical protein [Bifidobacterium amazonense]MCH9274873.1 hypothetical protein [Bifidobacterium amazonense]
MSDVRRYQGDDPASGGVLPTVMIPLDEASDLASSIRFVGERPAAEPDEDGSDGAEPDSIPTMPVDPADVATAERAAVSSSPAPYPSGSSDVWGEETVPLRPLSDSAPVPPPPSFFPSNTTGRMRPVSVPVAAQSRMVSGSSSFRSVQPERQGAKDESGFGGARQVRAAGEPRICYSSQYRALHPTD